MAKRKIKELPFDSYVIGIGASAGGLEAINDFFDHTPPDTGFAFVLVQHLSPDYKSLMPELLAKHTLMKVVEAEEGMTVQENCVYLLPSKKFLTVNDGVLRLQNKIAGNKPNNAIDIFLESLAEEYGKKAIGVVLSGTGSDGTKGLEHIKRKGGITIVQDPMTASFDGMPASAINAGVADLILSPDLMLNELIEYLKESKALKMFQLNSYRDELILRDILSLIRRETGNDFSHYKRPTLFRRLSKRLLELNITKVGDYLEYLHSHPEELKLIGQEFLINVTYFFRDAAAFDIIQHTVIPDIFRDKMPGDIVKVWSVACSSGEEAYSLAILFSEYMEKKKVYDVSLKIFATDIDRDAIDRAAKGIYPKSALRDVHTSRIEKYFTAEGEFYRINPEIRKLIVFSYQDVLKDPPFSRMDLVLCRNMLIYINAEAQKEVIRKVHFALNLDGYLVLGPSEHVGSAASSLQEIDKKWRVFKNVAKARITDRDQLFSPMDRHSGGFSALKARNPLQHIPELFKDTLLEEFKFAGIYIDQNFEVKQAAGAYKKYIDLPDSGFNFNLTKLVHPDLGIALNVAVRKAMKENQPVSMRRVKVGSGDKMRQVNIVVKPYLQQREYTEQFLFIVLQDDEKPSKIKVAGYSKLNAGEHIEELERELRETRENLQAVIEEIESANEELQSTNEEMVSTNEELQSTNEELQSLNEELHTVSAEHQLKIKELLDLNDDLNNFFKNSDIGQILIDRNLVVRRFSPAVTKLINLIDSDVNRSILDLNIRFNDPNFISDVRRVMVTGAAVEREIQLEEMSYLLKVSPYIKTDGSYEGVVITFIDVTEIRKLTNMLSAILNSSPSAIFALKPVRDREDRVTDFQIFSSNFTHSHMLGLPQSEIVGKTIRQLKFDSVDESNFRDALKSEGTIHYERFDEKTGHWFDVSVAHMADNLVVMATDVTEKKKAMDLLAQSFEDLKQASKKLKSTNLRLEQSNMDLLQFASVASHDLKEPLRKIQTFGNLLISKAKKKLAPAEQSYLEKMVGASGRMQRLIEDVLTLSKLSNRNQEFTSVDLNKVLQMIREDLEITVREKNAVIKVEQLPVIEGISGQMHQVFQNLISNALKFTDGRQPEIEIKHRQISKEEAKEMKLRPVAYHCISVKDNGIGFDEAYKEKIFGIFQRLNGSEYDGTGIGLAIVKKIMENHGGYITAESELNKGSQFHILLPKKYTSQVKGLAQSNMSDAQKN